MRDYHDTEWGNRVHGEAAYLERLTLEAFQSGLSWSTILNKRDAFREVFHGFDPDAIAAFGEDDEARLMQDARIVRNRAKISAAIVNARATVALREPPISTEGSRRWCCRSPPTTRRRRPPPRRCRRPHPSRRRSPRSSRSVASRSSGRPRCSR